MENLPRDMLAEIAIRVAKDAADPMGALANLRATCSQMKAPCGDPLVGRSIRLDLVLHRRVGVCGPLYYSLKYRESLCTSLLAVGNPEAYFRAGMYAVFVEGRCTSKPSLLMLQRAAALGHEAADYVLALVLYRANTGAADDDYARRVLRDIEGDNPATAGTWKSIKCTRPRRHAWSFRLGDLAEHIPEEWRTSHPIAQMVPRHDGHQCSQPKRCGRPRVSGGVVCSVFCSEECRIRDECMRFFGPVNLLQVDITGRARISFTLSPDGVVDQTN